jgi:hypothetical protein
VQPAGDEPRAGEEDEHEQQVQREHAGGHADADQAVPVGRSTGEATVAIAASARVATTAAVTTASRSRSDE